MASAEEDRFKHKLTGQLGGVEIMKFEDTRERIWFIETDF
jgi:hypothetical protein